jgi:TldD protein
MSASSSGDARHTVGASVAGPNPGLLDDPESVATFLLRATAAARLATVLPDAPAHPAGSFPLVIDYALAKGLAHEAFGHASEADGFRSSILAEGGRFRSGATVGASHVSIIDEPVAGDHAWQPFSASGLRRERATIVDHGRLADALTDPWSATSAGTRLTNADRAESFRSAPLPRMTNIRIEVDHPLAAPGAFESYGPAEVRDLLASAGVLARHPKVVFLSGYAGGQVNPATGDFVFNCKSIYVLSEAGVTLHKPAILSGSMFGALHAIREGFGPLLLDAIGTCGKWGQSVPSSGGSHYFLVLDPDDKVRLGGR